MARSIGLFTAARRFGVYPISQLTNSEPRRVPEIGLTCYVLAGGDGSLNVIRPVPDRAFRI